MMVHRHSRRLLLNGLQALICGLPSVASACDVCGCYFGLMPFERYHRTELMWRHSRFRGYRNIPPPLPTAGGTATQVLNKTQHDPALHQDENRTGPLYGDEDYERFHTVELRSSWFFTKRLNVAAVVPFKYSLDKIGGNQNTYSGLGDISVVPTYFPVWKDTTKWGIRWGVQLGVKAPTGRFATDDPAGEGLMQNGTGAWDFIPGTQVWLRWQKWGMAASASYRLSTSNAAGMRLMNTLNAQSVVFRRLRLGTRGQLLPGIGVYYENFDGAEYQEYWLAGTGGQMLSLHSALDVYWGKVGLTLQWQHPLVQDLLGTQMANAGRFNVGLAYLIPARSGMRP
ncbi:MAG: hypothetical protein KF690_03160 [Bacteroidetes bacterium]|nr:hypothetical protein [Bacteroidota bacterium]